MRPMFIVLEGIDGTGKTTACQRIKGFLESKGCKVKVTAEPSDSKIGTYVRNTDGLSPEVEALLFVADRGVHTDAMKKDIEDGYFVICDRYYLSTLAYQSASGMDLDWLKRMNSKVIMEPDITILLDVDPELSLARVGKRGETTRFEKLEYQKRVREAFLSLSKEKSYPIVDASKDMDSMCDDIIKIISKKV